MALDHLQQKLNVVEEHRDPVTGKELRSRLLKLAPPHATDHSQTRLSEPRSLRNKLQALINKLVPCQSLPMFWVMHLRKLGLGTNRFCSLDVFTYCQME